MFDNSAIRLAGVLVSISMSVTAGVCTASDLRQTALNAVQWALEESNAAVLADSLDLYLELGGSLEPDDPFTVAPMMHSLKSLDGGIVLAEKLIATRARGQLGGAPRIDIVIDAKDRHVVELTLVANEAAVVEARLWRASAGVDIDIQLLDAHGHPVAEDASPQTGVEGTGAYAEFWPTTCQPVTLNVINNGTQPGRVAVFVPQSLKSDCGQAE